MSGSRSCGRPGQRASILCNGGFTPIRTMPISISLRQRITELNAAGKMDKEIAQILNQEGFTTARGCRFRGENVWLLRDRWGIATVKINGVAANPTRWSDGSYSVQGAASLLGVTPQRSSSIIWPVACSMGRQLVKGQPWQIDPTDDQIRYLRNRLQRIRRSKKVAS